MDTNGTFLFCGKILLNFAIDCFAAQTTILQASNYMCILWMPYICVNSINLINWVDPPYLNNYLQKTKSNSCGARRPVRFRGKMPIFWGKMATWASCPNNIDFFVIIISKSISEVCLILFMTLNRPSLLLTYSAQFLNFTVDE